MTTLAIHTPSDIADARTQLRNIILAEKWSPTMCLRAVAALTSVCELMFNAGIAGNVDVELVVRQGRCGVRLSGCLSLKVGQTISLDKVSHQLTRAVDAVELTQNDNQIHLVVYLWSDNEAR
jgi:hypothetical protein